MSVRLREHFVCKMPLPFLHVLTLAFRLKVNMKIGWLPLFTWQRSISVYKLKRKKQMKLSILGLLDLQIDI